MEVVSHITIECDLDASIDHLIENFAAFLKDLVAKNDKLQSAAIKNMQIWSSNAPVIK